ncbi:MAG: proprotein convertase P-domain-containing protein [Polyangiaceae bacterium]|nr:proprotein convertase P-domain-containing protein [Polyangiaceae bacterium]MBK8938495.1 proprotein convertase P-domain-containing protein [Polyangiaceae bacterium]
MRSRHLALASLALVAVSCGAEDPTQDESDVTALPFAEGSRAARAAVAFVNDPATTDARLKKAGVTTTSARAAVLSHRDGADRAPGTSDDDRYDSLTELDAIRGVGPATLEKLSAYGLARGYGDDGGLYHGVYFTEKQADRVLDLANTASIAELDAETSVDARALATIEAARPIVSMSELSSLSRVKGTALRLLRDRADLELGPLSCGPDLKCEAGLFCTGGSTEPGRCVSTNVPGSGDPCSADEGVCGAGLVCGGRSEDFEGLCVPAWMKDEFANEGSGSIPDGPDGSVGVSVDVLGLATVPMDAIVTTRITHPRPSDLELTLINPSGTEVLVWPRGGGPIPASFAAPVPGDESANGLWTLRIADTQAGEQGTVSLFALELTTRFD